MLNIAKNKPLNDIRILNLIPLSEWIKTWLETNWKSRNLFLFFEKIIIQKKIIHVSKKLLRIIIINRISKSNQKSTNETIWNKIKERKGEKKALRQQKVAKNASETTFFSVLLVRMRNVVYLQLDYVSFSLLFFLFMMKTHQYFFLMIIMLMIMLKR